MGTERINAVADAGPLIHLAEIDALSLLTVFETLIIPEQVWHETITYIPTFSTAAKQMGNIIHECVAQPDLAQFVATCHLEHLHQGELACLYVNRQRSCPNLLTDDLAVRDAAKQLHVTPIGSLGIVVKAYRRGMLSLTDAERMITALQDVSSLFVTGAIVELVIEQLRQVR